MLRSQKDRAPTGVVRLLAAFDEYLLGWRRRDLVLDPAYARRIYPGGGVLRPSLLVDGRLVGTWRLTPAQVEPFEPLSKTIAAAVAAELRQKGFDAHVVGNHVEVRNATRAEVRRALAHRLSTTYAAEHVRVVVRP
jgi:hypothetical protein